MDSSELEKAIADIIDEFEEGDSNKCKDFAKAIEDYKELERQGLIKSRGNTLMPIEERYKLNIAHNKTRKMAL